MRVRLVRSAALALVAVLAVTFITYFIFFALPPGDPAQRFIGRSPSPALIQQVKADLGLDKPWYEQYGLFVKRLFTGDEYGWPGLGFSYTTKTAVRDELLERLPRTLSLVVGAAIIWVLLGVAVGVISAVWRGSPADRGAMLFALFGVSAPVFWLGLMALWIFWRNLAILPGTGYVPFSESAWGWFSHLLMPWFVLAMLYAALYARITRGTLLDTLSSDFIRTAYAKGASQTRVVVKHGLRASVPTIVTMMAVDIPLLMGGAIVTETVFNLQGVGAWAIESIFIDDLPVVMGVVVTVSVAVALCSVILDLTYQWLDPRARV